MDKFEKSSLHLDTAKKEITKVIIGQDEVIEQALVTIISGGHALLVGVPGLAKTLLVETLAQVLGLSSNRVQCTPDLMPADILGSEILDEDSKGKKHFRFVKGPIFTQFFMADEINRASPRTQAALLQAMQEKNVTIAGNAHKLPEPFHVLATQNPIEQEGTYPLPEAQLDRFLMQINVTYPNKEAERSIILNTTNNNTNNVNSVLNAKDLINIQNFIRDMPIGEHIVDIILNLVRSLRPGDDAINIVNEFINWAPGPRASQGLMLCVRARALLRGRTTALAEDVIACAPPILRHRMALNFKARSQNITIDDIISEIIQKI